MRRSIRLQNLHKTTLHSPIPPTSSDRSDTLASTKELGQWDVLPHGLGAKGDLLDGGLIDQQIGINSSSKIVKKSKTTTAKVSSRRGQPNGVGFGGQVTSKRLFTQITKSGIAPKDSVDPKSSYTPEGQQISKSQQFPENSLAPKISSTQETSSNINTLFKQEPLLTPEPSSIAETGQASAPNSESNTQPLSKKKVDSLTDLLDRVDNIVRSDAKKKKKHPYQINYKESPFPDHTSPTPEQCEEVYQLLSQKHGAIEQPTQIPAPSLEVTGCGEVPDLLDAILRTLLSAATSSTNSNKALLGLKNTFGLRTSREGIESINWEAVHKADEETVIKSIWSGGLAVLKGRNIKSILDIVFAQNCERRDALLKEKSDGTVANIPGVEHLTREQKDDEVSRIKENPYSLDWIFELRDASEAMDELVKLPGIGVKTASCVILFCMKRPSFAVDTHVWRHCKWLGWVPPKANRNQTFNHCDLSIPDHLKYPLHQLFLKHGKECGRCRANTHAGTEEWEKADCPIEHLVNRTEAKKQLGYKAAPKRKFSEVSDESESGEN
ncbi:hypothetical protein G7Y89_g7202 [Cudoniella acicularis]|uniref:HhH-GPD domain-containing protein n=1 Tax=Cudoniella acicularis TaxID=354080 RepID=A0A8H4RIZ9_9HELO|nr:hypothetical protein G7Y89_g7202 [Cudoniella acicularis]